MNLKSNMIARQCCCILFFAILINSFTKTITLTDAEFKRLSQVVSLNTRLTKLGFNDFLQGVFDALTKDRRFSTEIREIQNQNLEKAEPGKILDEKIADHFKKLPSSILRKLTELKRLELKRLLRLGETLWRKGYTEREISDHIQGETKHLDLSPTRRKEHETFTEKDLRLLIRETNKRLADLDEARKKHFKEYEMQKKLEFEELRKRLPAHEQAEIDKRVEELMKLHRRKKPAHLPMSKAHIMEVWQEKDQMDRGNLNMKSFFHLHDLDGNRMWDENEIKVLLEQEVEKIHDRSSQDFDSREKEEELERMREYSFKHMDQDRDGLVSMQEFIEANERLGLTDSEFWESLGAKPQFTEEEYEKYASENRKEVNQMIDEGRITLPHTGVVKHFLKPKK